ncbi:MAG: hypothetical protein HEQ22_03455 [Sphingopyxis sp.]|uniref:hypothetical protein n=1 Tax=Sphingopyxis sp. TaxID=1908224 RepID=UPI003D80C090
MPQALTAWLVQIGLSQLAAALVTTAVTIGASILANSLFGPSRPKPSDGQQNIRVAIGSRKRHYGIVCTGGQETFYESRNGTIAKVVTLGTGEESDILEHKINDQVVTVVGGTITDAKFHGAVHIHTRSGTNDQTAISELTAKFPEWTANHRQRGCSLAAIIGDPVKQKIFGEVYNGQIPLYTQTRKAAKLYDPRKDSTAVIYDDGAGFTVNGTGPHRVADLSTREWTDNAALVIGDYAAHPDGYGLGYDNVNWASIAGEADYSDLTETTVTDEEIASWRLWASYGLASEERRQVLADMLKACDGHVWQDADWKFNLMVGRYEEPTVVITDDHILGMTAKRGPQARHAVSALKPIYTEAAIGYREQEGATVAFPGGEDDPNTDPQPLEVPFAPHHNQAARLGKINLARLGDRWHLNGALNLFGLNLIGKRFCRVQSAQLGIDAVFLIGGVRLELAQQRVMPVLDEVLPEDWAFDAELEEGVPPLAPDTTPTVPTVPPPTDLVLSAVQIALGETNGVAISASWTSPRADLGFRAQYRPAAGGEWVMMAVDEDALTARSGPVDSGVEYQVQVWSLTVGYRESPVVSGTITPEAANVLGPPTDLAAEGGVGEAGISFRMPTQSSLAYARLYGSDTPDFGTAVQVGPDRVAGLGAIVEITEVSLSAGTRYYWARAFKAGSGSSALAGPVSATIS